MKKIAILLFMLASVHAGMQAQTLVLHHKDGTTTDVELYTQPRVEFQGDHVLITSTVLNMEYAKDDVLRFTYKGKPSGVTPMVRESGYRREGDCLVFHGVKQADQVAVYTSAGIRMPVRLSFSGTDAVLSLSQIPTGVYLLSVNGRTSKFTKP